MKSMTTTGSGAKPIAINGMCIALTVLATAFLNVRLPIGGNGGLIHLGNVPLFFAAILFGRKTGAVAGAFGMGLFDLFSGWTAWAPFTFVIVGCMGYTVGRVAEGKSQCSAGTQILWYSLGIALALVLKVAGYYVAEGILYGNWVVPLASIPGNVLQVLIAALVVLPTSVMLQKTIGKQMK